MLNNYAIQQWLSDTHGTAMEDHLLHLTEGNPVEHHFIEIAQTDPVGAAGFVLSFLCLGLLVASVLSDRLKSHVKWTGTIGGKLALIMVGAFFLILPLDLHTKIRGTGLVWPHLSGAIPSSIYVTVQMLVMQVDLATWSAAIESFMGTGPLSHLYIWLITFYCVASPIALALTAVDVFLNGVTGLVLWGDSFKKALRRRDVYVFYGLSENTVTLACDLLAHVSSDEADRRERMPLLIFCNVVNGQNIANDGLAQKVRTAALRAGTVVFTPLTLSSVPEHLSPSCRRRCTINYMLLSDDTRTNVREAVGLLNTLMGEMVAWELAARGWDASAIGDSPTLLARTKAYAARQHIWVTHSNPDDDLIFDTLPDQAPDDQIMMRLMRHHIRRGRGPGRRERIDRQLTPLQAEVRALIEMRLLSDQREVIWNALDDMALTSVLDPVDVAGGIVPQQLLVVVVAGMGSYGVEAIRAIFWFGRLPGVELRIIAMDLHGKVALGKVMASWPDLAAERTPTASMGLGPQDTAGKDAPVTADGTQGEADGKAGGHGCGRPKDRPYPTLVALEGDCQGPLFTDLLEGERVSGWAAGTDGLESVDVSIPDEARVYTMVVLDEDQRDLDVALRVHRVLSHRILKGRLAVPAPGVENPVVALRLQNQEVLDSIREVAGDSEHMALHPFGSVAMTYSWNTIFAAPWDKGALNLQAAKDDAWALVMGGDGRETRARAMERFNAQEVRRLDDRAAVRFTPYRLWCLGLGSDEGLLEPELHRRWIEKLGMVGVGTDVEKGDKLAMGLICGQAYGPKGWDAAARQGRVEAHRQMERQIRDRWPVAYEMGILEHRRWCAFMAAQGWQGVEGGFEGLQAMDRLVGLVPDPEHPYPHLSQRLRRDYYLVANPTEYGERGAQCGDSPEAQDRLLVAESLRAMAGQIVAPDHDGPLARLVRRLARRHHHRHGRG